MAEASLSLEFVIEAAASIECKARREGLAKFSC
jgi:hypothetical protein